MGRHSTSEIVKHEWSYCLLCRCNTVICGKCGNNTCNGGSGEINKNPCTSCLEAHNLSKKYGEKISKMLPISASKLTIEDAKPIFKIVLKSAFQEIEKPFNLS